jgi:hypothetical protein
LYSIEEEKEMIHYIGKLQAGPEGKRACGAVSGQADSRSWHAVDCGDCKATLVGLQVRWIGTGQAIGNVRSVQGNRVVIFSHAGADSPSLFELENSWEKAPSDECEMCHERPGRKVIDPYALEINDQEIEMVLCESCLQDRTDESCLQDRTDDI